MSSTSIGQPAIPQDPDTDSIESDGKTLSDRGTNETERTPDPSLERAAGAQPHNGKYTGGSPYVAGNQ